MVVLSTLLLILGLAAPPAPAKAGELYAQRGERNSRQQHGSEARVSLDAAVAAVRRASGGGTVLRAETRSQGGSVVYYIKVLSPDGRIRVYRVDGRTGRISP